MIRQLLHLGVSWFQTTRRLVWFITRPRTTGVHAVPLTREGKVVLVTLSYAKGWRLPGGGQKRSETREAAVLRELREEIGMTSWESLEAVCTFRHRPDFRRGRGSLFVVRGVCYRPKWSLEVRDIGEFDPFELPVDTATITRKLINEAGLDFNVAVATRV